MSSLQPNERAEHNPNYDVEVAEALAPLLPTHLDRLMASLSDAYAVGVTPTYQAISSAYDVLGGQSGQIIVLTDGKPFLAGAEARATAMRTQAAAKHGNALGIRLSIVNFESNEADATLKSAFPNAKFTKANDGQQLADFLQGTLGQARVVWKQNTSDLSSFGELSDLVTIDPWPPKLPGAIAGQPIRPAQRYEVEVTNRDTGDKVTTPVFVEGGEVFSFEQHDRQLLHKPFPRGDHVFKELQSDGKDKSRFNVLALPPDLNNNRELTLRLVIENSTATKFTPRPSDVWIELTGFDSARQRSVAYTINAAEYESGQGVPVLLCRVTDWQPWADNVQIHAWLRFSDPVASRTPLPLDHADSVRLPSLADVAFRVDRNQGDDDTFDLLVTETHPAGSKIRQMRLLADPLPHEAVTRFYPENGLVERVFRYKERPDDLQIYVTERAQMIDDASLHVSGSLPVK